MATSGWCATTWEGDESAVWTTAGNWTDGVPDAADDVTITGSNACTLAGSTTVNSINFTDYTGTFTHNASVTLTIDGQDGSGNSLLMVSGMTYTTTPATSRITFTGAGTSKITTGTRVLPNVTFNNAGDTFQLQDNLIFNGTSTTALYLQAGTFDANTKTVTSTSTGATISGAFTFVNLTVTGNANKTDYLYLASDITITGTFTLTGNSAVNRLLLASSTLGTARTITLGAAATTAITKSDFRDITLADNARTISSAATADGGASVEFTTAVVHELVTGDEVTIAGTTDYNGTFTVTSTSSTTKFKITDTYVSDQAGTFTRTNWNLVSIAGGSGNCGGNTGITFTTADDWYWSSGAGNFSDTTKWFTASGGGGSRMSDADPRGANAPLPQDTFYLDAASFSSQVVISEDMPRIGSIIESGTDTNSQITWDSSGQIYGSLTLESGMILYAITNMYFYGRGANTITLAGETIQGGHVYFDTIGGSVTLTDNFSVSGSAGYQIYYNSGTLTAQGNVDYVIFNADATVARTLNMGSGTWATTYAYTGGNYSLWSVATNVTVNADTSTLSFGGNNTRVYTFAGNSKTYNNFSVIAGGSGNVTISGSNTFNTLTINAPKTVKFTAGTTTTVTSFVAEGTVANPIVLDNTTATGSLAAVLSDTTGTNTVKYCTIGTTYNVNAATAGDAVWNALITDGNTVTNGTGWTTTAASTRNRLILF